MSEAVALQVLMAWRAVKFICGDRGDRRRQATHQQQYKNWTEKKTRVTKVLAII